MRQPFPLPSDYAPASTGSPTVVVIGGGFCGLSAAYELAGRGIPATLLEADEEVGGLAGSFGVGPTRLERFYHHWFTNDAEVMRLVNELGVAGNVVTRPSRTGMYYANRHYRLASPLDLLRFSPLRPADRVRLGMLVLRARRGGDLAKLGEMTASEWVRREAGEAVYRVVWEPLLKAKFGPYAERIAASWLCSKLRLRGGSRGRDGRERLAYYRGGFAALADAMVERIRSMGGVVRTGVPVERILTEQGRVCGVRAGGKVTPAQAVISTPATPVLAALLGDGAPADYLETLRAIPYLANVCLVLELSRSLSDLYWININDPGFPFVGVIEHTNFEPAGSYGGRHIVYLSRYLLPEDPIYQMSAAELTDFALPHLQRMAPGFSREWILRAHAWRARYAQPVVTVGYAARIPKVESPIRGLYVATMAQVYPEDRGTNYAIRDGRAIGLHVAGVTGLT